jgi:hypothetical protein
MRSLHGAISLANLPAARTSEHPGHSQRILRAVGLCIRLIRTLSNHPTYVPALQGFGIEMSPSRRVQ